MSLSCEFHFRVYKRAVMNVSYMAPLACETSVFWSGRFSSVWVRTSVPCWLRTATLLLWLIRLFTPLPSYFFLLVTYSALNSGNPITVPIYYNNNYLLMNSCIFDRSRESAEFNLDIMLLMHPDFFTMLKPFSKQVCQFVNSTALANSLFPNLCYWQPDLCLCPLLWFFF